jgi:outer membrane protein OmpA-like peptidoglycan-associated protein
LLLFIVGNLFSQAGSYLKMIENGKYPKLEKKIKKQLLKEPNDVGLNYVMAKLSVVRGYTAYDPTIGYKFNGDAERYFLALSDEKELKKLKNIPIDAQIIEQQFDTICLRALEDAISDNTVESYEGYLEFYVRASDSYKNRAIISRDIAAFKVAEGKNTVAAYQYFIDKYPKAVQKQQAISERNNVAFAEASSKNTVESFQYFIDTYPDAMQVQDAVRKRNELAYANAKSKNSIEAYKKFIDKYPKAEQVKDAWENIYTLDFADAQKQNTADRYYKHMRNYPNSSFFSRAKSASEDCEFNETIVEGDINSYLSFVNNFRNNPKKSIALDTLFNYYEQKIAFQGMENCINNAEISQKKKLILRYHDIYTVDGEWTTLNKFYEKYNYDFLSEIKREDYRIAEMGKSIVLNRGYNEEMFDQFDNYIKSAAPKHRAFIALQRMIKSKIDEKKYDLAVSTVKSYAEYFKNDKHFENLITLLEKKFDNSIIIQAINEVNDSEKGRQYCPELSADEKTLYFCGNDREDNKGREDIFYSTKTIYGGWSKPKLMDELCTSFGNEAMEHVNADNTTFYYFNNGKSNIVELNQNGMGTPELLSPNINQGGWQADLCISGDGNALFFSSVYSDNFNYNIKSSIEMTGQLSDYHGTSNHQSDIYVSIKDENGNWGKSINLGRTINTIHADRSPFLHPDMKTLYFSSDGHGGFGDLDVFVSKRLADSCWDCWSEPINLGKEINSVNSDWGYLINTGGDKAYFSRNSKIYFLNLPKQLRPDYVATVSGTVKGDNGEVVPCAIKWEDLETGRVIGTSKTNPKDGSYFMVLPLGKNYGYYIEKEGYFPPSNNLNVINVNKPTAFSEDIKLVTFEKMIEESIPARINNLFFNTGESVLLPASIPELKRVAGIIKKNNLKVEILGHTDIVGDDKMNQTLSEKRAASVKEFLVKEGCQETMMKTTGFGKTKPVARNDTEEGRAKNRRVEIKFLK